MVFLIGWSNVSNLLEKYILNLEITHSLFLYIQHYSQTAAEQFSAFSVTMYVMII